MIISLTFVSVRALDAPASVASRSKRSRNTERTPGVHNKHNNKQPNNANQITNRQHQSHQSAAQNFTYQQHQTTAAMHVSSSPNWQYICTNAYNYTFYTNVLDAINAVAYLFQRSIQLTLNMHRSIYLHYQ